MNDWRDLIPGDVKAEIDSLRAFAKSTDESMKYCDSSKVKYFHQMKQDSAIRRANALEHPYIPARVLEGWEKEAEAKREAWRISQADNYENLKKNQAKAIASAIKQLGDSK